jgi:hypothetical protein
MVCWEGWHAEHSITRSMPANLPGDPAKNQHRRRRSKVKVAVNGSAKRTAARLLCEHPEINLDDERIVIDRCLAFGADLRGADGYKDVKRQAKDLRFRAEVAAKQSWTADELHQCANKLYDSQKGVEEQSYEFYSTQAHYRLVKGVRARSHQ